MRHASLRLFVLLLAGVGLSAPLGAQGSDFKAGSRTLYAVDIATVPVGEFPKGMKLLRGNVTVVDHDGQRMLRASDPAAIFISFGEAVPADFTVEIDLVPKPFGVGPDDLVIEGTMTSDRGPASAQLVWSSQRIEVTGGGEMFQREPPEDLKVSTPSQLTEIRTSFDNGTLKLYVNGQRVFNLPGRKWARTRGIRIDLGGSGQDEDKESVYVAKIRIATNSPEPQ